MQTLFYAARPIVSDMLSTLLFAALFALTDNLYLSTGCAVALGVGQLAWVRLRGRAIPGMQWASLGLVVVLGGVTLLTGDPRFVMVKPTIVYLTIGAAMMQRGWLGRYIPPDAHALVPERVFVVWGYVWAGLMIITAVANLVIAVALGRQAWLLFVGAFPLFSKLGLFAVTYLHIRYRAIRSRPAQEAGAARKAQVSGRAGWNYGSVGGGNKG